MSFTPSSGPMTHIPEELIEIILLKVKCDSSIQAFWKSCMPTCRQWHRIGLGFHRALGFAVPVTLESPIQRQCGMQEQSASHFPLVSDFDFSGPSELYLSRLKSFAIHIRHQCVAVPFRPDPGVGIVEGLSKSFGCMPDLTTFSMKLSDGWDYGQLDIPVVPQSFLAKIVAALPHHVVDLEIDTACADIPSSQELIEQKQEDHLCFQISRIIRRLRHLRLRTGHICPDLFDFEHDAQPCKTALTCDFCSIQEARTCDLVRNWNMKSMVLWLPHNATTLSQKYSSSTTSPNQHFLLSTTALLNPNLHNSTRILLIQQSLLFTQRSYGDTQPLALWVPRSNISPTLIARLPSHFSSQPISTKTLKPPTSYNHTPAIHEYNLSYTTGNHNDWPEPGNATIYEWLAVATLEGMMGWTSRSVDGYRFPISESEKEKMTWHKQENLWYCQFPDCTAPPSPSIVALRGHVMYAHGSARLQRQAGLHDPYVPPPPLPELPRMMQGW